MSKSIKQFRYYSNSNALNQTSNNNVTIEELLTGSFIENYSIVQLGIQSLPGTKFFLGSNLVDSGIIIGQTGIFELDVNNLSSNIYGLRIDPMSMKNIKDNPLGYIIIDLIYESN